MRQGHQGHYSLFRMCAIRPHRSADIHPSDLARPSRKPAMDRHRLYNIHHIPRSGIVTQFIAANDKKIIALGTHSLGITAWTGCVKNMHNSSSNNSVFPWPVRTITSGASVRCGTEK